MNRARKDELLERILLNSKLVKLLSRDDLTPKQKQEEAIRLVEEAGKKVRL